ADWLQARLAQLDPPAYVERVSAIEETNDWDRFNLILMQNPPLTDRPHALVCAGEITEDGNLHLIPADADQLAMVHLLEQHLQMRLDVVRRAEQMRLVNQVGVEIAGIHELDGILNLIPDRLTDRFGYYYAAVGLNGPDYIEMYEASRSRRLAAPDHYRIARNAPGMIPWVAQHGRPHLSNNTQQDRLWIAGKGLEASRSELTIPLVYHDRVLGVIDVQSEQIGAFDQIDISVLEALAGQLAVAIENIRLMEEGRRQRRLAEILSHISRLASSLVHVDQVSETILRELGQLVVFDGAFVVLYENNSFRIAHQIGFGAVDAPMLRWLIDESPLLYRVVNQQEPVWIADTNEDRLWQKTGQEPFIRSWLGVPLLSRERPIGVMAISRLTPHAYQQVDADILLAVANQIAGVIDNAYLLEQSELREREARALYEITHLLVTLDSGSILSSLLRQLGEALPFDAAGILVVNGAAHLLITARRTVAETAITELENRLCRAFDALSHEPVNSHTASHQVIWTGPLAEGKPIENLPSCLSAPLLVGRQVVGVIELCKTDSAPYTEAQLRTLYTIANSTATALENARLYQELMARALNLQQAVDELAEADRLKEELVGTVSHELRSPLTYVVGYVDLLLEGEMGALTEDQRRSLEIVATKTKTLTRLVTDILSFEKTQADDLNLVPVNVSDIARQVVQDISRPAADAGVHVRTDLDPSVGLVMADAGRIEQVLNNLLGNALKFSPADSTITVRTLACDACVRVEVEDAGIGIPADKLPRVFDRFYQVNVESR
ncbi:MAG: GAF domain-containing protein, partial [Chloroflexi bacterium]